MFGYIIKTYLVCDSHFDRGESYYLYALFSWSTLRMTWQGHSWVQNK